MLAAKFYCLQNRYYMDAFAFLPKCISTYGGEIDSLFWLIIGITFFAFFVSLYVLLKPLFTNHYSKVPRARYFTGEGKQYRWITAALIGLALSDLVILLQEHHAWATIESHLPQADFEVAVIGRQWNFIFVYPGPDGKLNTADDVRVDKPDSELHVPVNKNVVVNLMATDVLHSFWVPNIRLKQDCIPGRTIKRWFNATETGRYEIACAEICGILHSKMRNFLVVDDQATFDAYIRELYAPPATDSTKTQ